MPPFAIRLRSPRCATPNRNQTGSARSPALQYGRPPLRAFVATESPPRFSGPSRSAHPTLQSTPRRARYDDTFLLEAPRHPQGGARVAAETLYSSFQSERESPARRVGLWWVTLGRLERGGQGGRRRRWFGPVMISMCQKPNLDRQPGSSPILDPARGNG